MSFESDILNAEPAPSLFSNPFSFNGRIRRTEFGISYIICFVIYFIGILIMNIPEIAFLGLLFWGPLIWFIIAQCTKRCHDLGKSGWWQLIPFYVFWLLFAEGDHAENEFGRPAK